MAAESVEHPVGPDEEVIVSSRHKSQRYHTNPECEGLKRAKNQRTVKRGVLADIFEPCQKAMCEGEKTPMEIPEIDCPRCGEVVPKNKLRWHLPKCGGGV